MQCFRIARWAESVRWVLLLALLGLVCHPQGASAATKAITQSDRGREVHLKIGDTLKLTLDAKLSTGYRWFVRAGSSPLLKLVHQTDEDTTDYSGSVPAPGGDSEAEIFRFAAKKQGKVQLRLYSSRTQESSLSSESDFTITVVIE